MQNKKPSMGRVWIILLVLNPGGVDSHLKGAGMLVKNFELNPLRRPNIWAWPELFLTPKRDHFKTDIKNTATFRVQP